MSSSAAAQLGHTAPEKYDPRTMTMSRAAMAGPLLRGTDDTQN